MVVEEIMVIKPSPGGAICKMGNTYSQIYIQLVFTVKGRGCFIKKSFRQELQKYMTGIITYKKQKLFTIYCMPDPAHILVSMKPDMTISDLVRDNKANSSSFIKDKKIVKGSFSWQEGFGTFSYSKSHAADVVNYILNQPDRHRNFKFREEYFDFLDKFEIEYNEKYLFEYYDQKNIAPPGLHQNLN